MLQKVFPYTKTIFGMWQSTHFIFHLVKKQLVAWYTSVAINAPPILPLSMCIFFGFIFFGFLKFFFGKKTINMAFVSKVPEDIVLKAFPQDSLVWPFSAVFRGKSEILRVQNFGKNKIKSLYHTN